MAQVKEFGPAHLAIADYFKLIDVRRILRENTLYGNAVRYLSNGEGFGDSRSAFLDHDSLEHLDAFLRAFFDFIMDLHSIAGAILGKVGSDLVSANCVQNIHGSSHICTRKKGGPTRRSRHYGRTDDCSPLGL